jgi:hypothetical protein
MKKKFFVLTAIIAIFTIANSWAQCEADKSCTPDGDGCNYVCLGEVYVVGNMDKLELIEGLKPEL